MVLYFKNNLEVFQSACLICIVLFVWADKENIGWVSGVFLDYLFDPTIE